MSLNRRDFIKSSLIAPAASAVGISIPSKIQASTEKNDASWRWDKSVCHLCGVGCGIMMATKNGKIVATKGDSKSPVNRGLLCIKGKFNTKTMYGADRLTQPLLRMNSKGLFDKKGKFKPVSWERAFDEMELQIKKTLKKHGPDGVAVFSSGTSTIMEGYAALKMMKAGFRSNAIESNTRQGLSSAVTGFYQSFGTDHPAGCYDDIELTDTIISWGANMAETQPILWSRVTDRKLSNSQNVKVINLSTYKNRTSDLADETIIFTPHTDLAIWNYIAREIVYNQPESIDWEFIRKHTIFAAAPVNIGKKGTKTISHTEAPSLKPYGYKEGTPMQNRPQGLRHWEVSFEEYRKSLEPYTLEYVTSIAKGDTNETASEFARKLKFLANLYAKKGRKVVSFWSAGMNQHTRGTWVNTLAYNVHLLTNKQANPGNGAFSLAGQVSSSGTSREVGLFTHRLPADLMVKNPKHRGITENRWSIPKGTLNSVGNQHFMKIHEELVNGDIGFLWINATNPYQSSPDVSRWIKAARETNKFIVTSDVYPGISGKVSDLILPSAMTYEKWGAFGNAERRTQHWRQQVLPVGDAMSETWQWIELSKRFTVNDLWGAYKKRGSRRALKDVRDSANELGYSKDTTMYEILFANDKAKSYKLKMGSFPQKGFDNSEALGDSREIIGSDGERFDGYGFMIQEYLFEEYASFGRGHGFDLASFTTYHKNRGLRWPVVDGKETNWRFNAKYDPYAAKVTRESNEKYAFYGPLAKALQQGSLLSRDRSSKKISLKNRAKIFAHPYMDPPEMPDTNYDLWATTSRVLEHWGSGTMTMRVGSLYNAVSDALCYMDPQDAKKRGLSQGSLCWIESRRGRIKAKVETKGRNLPASGLVVIPWFDEKVFTNKTTLNALCPISKQADNKKFAVKIYGA